MSSEDIVSLRKTQRESDRQTCSRILQESAICWGWWTVEFMAKGGERRGRESRMVRKEKGGGCRYMGRRRLQV